MDFVAKHLVRSLLPDGIQRVSLPGQDLQGDRGELVGAPGIHDARLATLIIYRDRVETTNAAHPHLPWRPIKVGSFYPYPLEPDAFQVLQADGPVVQELGSGGLDDRQIPPLYAKGAKALSVEGNSLSPSSRCWQKLRRRFRGRVRREK